MNYFILKHYYFYFSCDSKWHKINLLDGLFGKSVAQNFGFRGGRNEDGVSKRGVNGTGSWGVESVTVCGVRNRVFKIGFPSFWDCVNQPIVCSERNAQIESYCKFVLILVWQEHVRNHF